jgi:ATP-dependent exoDNAse (exonuclease V) beta subunit
VQDEAEFFLAPTTLPRTLPRQSASSREGGKRVAGDLLRRHDPAAATRGVLVHRWMEEIEWLDAFERDDAELLELGRHIEPDERARAAALAIFRAALEHAPIRDLLRRPTSGEALVENERPFSLHLLDEEGAAQHWQGSIDRLVQYREQGRATSVDLIDFKTDVVDDRGIGERVDYYRPQLLAYRRVAAALLDLPEERIQARLAFLSTGEIVPV